MSPLLLIAGSLAVIFVGFMIASIWRASRTLAAMQHENEKALPQEPVKPKLTRALVQANIAADQWEILVDRLGRAIITAEDDCSSWGSSVKPRKCVGLISLDVDNAYNEKKLRPMPLLRSVRQQLNELGFVISDDGLWATYVEQADEADEKAVREPELERIGEPVRLKY